MILLDANILMYAAGRPHAHKAPSVALLARIARGEVDAAVDAEVLQEILHRYSALKQWKTGRKLYDNARIILPRVVPITADVLDEARALMDTVPNLMARDALHAAVVTTSGATAFVSFDADVDRIPGVRRLEPADVR